MVRTDDSIMGHGADAPEVAPQSVVEQGLKPGAWCLAALVIMLVASMARVALASKQRRGESRWDAGFWFWIGMAVASAPMSGLLLRAVFSAAQDISLTLIYAVDIAEELSTLMLCRVFAFWVKTEAASRAQDQTRWKQELNVREPEVQVPFATQVGITITFGTLDALGSFCKSLSLVGISVSTTLVIRALSVPMALGLSALGFGKGCMPREGQRGPCSFRTLLLLAGTACFIASALLSPKTPGMSHRSTVLGFGVTSQTCVAWMSGSVLLGVVTGQMKEYLLHRRTCTPTHVQALASAGSTAISTALLLGGIWIEGRPTWLCRSTIPAMAYPLLVGAVCKAFDQMGEVMIIEKADYASKKALSFLKVVPAKMFEIIAFYVFGNVIVGRPWGLNSWLVLAGLVAIMSSMTL